ncbi:TIR-like protein FxsC [Streptomyces sp. NPDC058463]|uniref:TIR-like protein FxsC n=1 Tax=Streptomyces sp. NPDC058463 TaxID=3346510 RepID=UPI00364CEADF
MPGHCGPAFSRSSRGGAVGPYFFLSYARTDDQDAYVRRFYDDLCAQIMELAGSAVRLPVGFRDNSSIRIGEHWSERLESVLGICHSMVALYSPDYFRSEWCSREAGVMMRRANQYFARTQKGSSALIPVLWRPVDIPSEVAHIQYVTDGFGSWYADAGLQRLLQKDPAGEDYRNAVRLVAQRVLYVAEREKLPVANGIRLAQEPLSFPPRTAPTRPGSTVQFFVAAGTADTLPEERRSAPYYGRAGLDWNPYHPQEEYPIYQVAQRLVTAQGYGTAYREVRSGLTRQLNQAWRDDQVSILLVDAWSAPVSPYREQLEQFDRTEHPATGVLVPCHPREEGERGELWRGVTEVFERKSSRGTQDRQFQVRVSATDFKQALGRMVSSAQNNLIRKRHAPVAPGAGEQGTVSARPILRGPTSGTGSGPGSAPPRIPGPAGGTPQAGPPADRPVNRPRRPGGHGPLDSRGDGGAGR